MPRRGNGHSFRRAGALALLFFAVLCALLLYLRPWTKPAADSGDLALHMINVGQGDALLLVSGEQTMLIDGGPPDASEALLSYLRAQNVRKLDYVVLTHGHNDHFGGLKQVFEEYKVGLFLLYDGPETESIYSFAGELTGANDCELELTSAGRSYRLGNAEITVLSPQSGAAPGDENDGSLVLLVQSGSHRFLLTGDAGSEALEALDLPKIEVLKAAHHGSISGTSEQLLSLTSPAHALISCGADNEYGHPHDECLRRLTQAGVQVWRTDKDGSVVAAVTGETLHITTTR